MTKAPKVFKPNMHTLEPYPVGYGKPPKDNQFKQGQSGNPSGRPKGSTNKLSSQHLKLHDILLHEAYRTVTIQDKDGPIQLSVAQAAMRSLALKAAQGHVGAQKLFMESLHIIETEQANQTSEILQSFFLYKQKARAILQQRKAQGLPLHEDDFIPHPDHIDIDIRCMEISIKGPVDEKDKRLWDKLWQTKKEYEDTVNALRSHKSTQRNKNLSNLVQKALYFLELYEQTIMIRWGLPVEDVVKEHNRWQSMEQRVKGIQNGILNFDGSVIL
ncbi:DUF5681 domain-containing protein [Bartonella tamiae]|uniref:DUF5681 domain-containing protein n=1 Tax=Bartonella tamiae Th239 TaxID=1094558 RepID=J1JZW0_9HYPH|nr:DUF5681 domain-containing protein [Bartonella tamiae]EJF90295.1 hypothetical protein ME5_00696 [Bartonella tamiae Th239]EJF93764.1 hypothetical protein MEG_01188 [Bartonella tamiae Th307]